MTIFLVPLFIFTLFFPSARGQSRTGGETMSGTKSEVAVFGGGCFWCTEAVFDELRGVNSVVSGYAGGSTKNPTYEQVCGGGTGPSPVIKIEFDPDEIAFRDLLTV